MTILYRPVLIESAEQAEALPAGTIALHGSPGGRSVASRLPDPHGLLLGWITSDGRESFEGMVGWTALVPVEAREERTWISSKLAGPMHVGFGAAFDTPHARLVTPWEEA